jgi:hypothetical protein
MTWYKALSAFPGDLNEWSVMVNFLLFGKVRATNSLHKLLQMQVMM